MRVTIGVPAFNAERHIEASIESLLSQTLSDFELFIADNASTDGTESICRHYASRDSRVRYVRHQSNIGIFRNYDFVFGKCQTEYFKWASSNDICRPRFLERCVDVLDARPEVVLCSPSTAAFDESSKELRELPPSPFMDMPDPVARYVAIINKVALNNLVNGVVRSSALRKTSLNRAYQGSDINLVAELALLGRVVELEEVLFLRCQSKDATVASTNPADLETYYRHEPRAVTKRPTSTFVWNQLRALRLPMMTSSRLRLAGFLITRFWINKTNIAREVAGLAQPAHSLH